MIRSLGVAAALAVALTSCLHGDGNLVEPRKARGAIDLIRTDQVNYFLDVEVPPEVGKQIPSPNDRLVEAKCGAEGSTRSPILAGIAVVVAGWVIDYAIGEISQAAQRRVAEYSGLTTGALRFGPPAGSSFYTPSPPNLNMQCIRLRRTIPQEGKQDWLASEVILRVDTTQANDALILTPLRIYFDKPLARTNTNAKFGISVGATFDALWKAEKTGEGKAVRIWTTTVASERITKVQEGSNGRFFYYNLRPEGLSRDLPENAPVVVPLVPWSLDYGTQPGMGTLSLTFAEVSDPPVWLKFTAGVLKDHGNDIGSLLKDAAKKALEP